MSISAKDENILYEYYKNGEEMIFTGCNCDGVEFETTGRLSTVTGREMGLGHFERDDIFFGIVEDAFLVEFGGYDPDDKVRTKYSALFHTDLEAIFPEMNNQFMLESIRLKRTNEVLYFNNKYEAYYEELQEAFKDKQKQNLDNVELLAEDEITIDQLLEALISKPVDIEGDKGVLSYYTKNEKKEIEIYYFNFDQLKSHILKDGLLIKPINGVWNFRYEKIKESEK